MQSKLFLVTIILFISEKYVAYGYREFNVDGVRTILSLENENINIQCETDMPMAYCGFIHPSGQRFSFLGATLIDGHCAININATKEDSGEWNCHIGKRSIGVEIKQRILVRVVDKLAAIQGNMSVVHGKEATLSCTTTKTLTPLSYCRFEPPNGSPFSIASNVNKTNAILGRYWFPQNKSLDRGDCAVTIRKIKYEDVGLWTCGAGLDDGKEYIDVIHVEVQGLYTMSTASVTGVTFGIIGVIIFLAILGFIAWKKRRVLGSGRVVEAHELRDVLARPPRRIPEESPQTVLLSTKQASPKFARQSSPQGSPKRARQSSPQRSPKGARQSTPQTSPKTPGRSTPQASPKKSRPTTPQASPRTPRRSTPQGSPKTPRRSTPQGSPKTPRRSTPQASPTTAKVIPSVVVQSPSEASTSLQDQL